MKMLKKNKELLHKTLDKLITKASQEVNKEGIFDLKLENFLTNKALNSTIITIGTELCFWANGDFVVEDNYLHKVKYSEDGKKMKDVIKSF